MKKLFVALCLFLISLTPVIANAYSITLGIPNSAISNYDDPYATLDVSLTDATHAVLLLTATSPYHIGDGSSLAVNVNSTDILWRGRVTITQPAGFIVPTYTRDSGNVSEFGVFNFILDANDGWTRSVLSLQTTIINKSGTWTSAEDVLIPNASGYVVASHIFPGVDMETGFAGNGEKPPQVPEASSLLLLCLGLGMITLYRKE